MIWIAVLQMKIGKCFLRIEKMIIKAISVKQPWASMIQQGWKNIETRTWYTDHRGDLLIVSTLKPEYPGCPCGFALCVVNLKNCRPMILSDEAGARCEYREDLKLFAWVLSDIREIRPFRVRGRQGLYDMEIED